MKQFEKWRSLCITGLALGFMLSILLFLKKEYIYMIAALIVWIVYLCFLWLLEIFKRTWNEDGSGYFKSFR